MSKHSQAEGALCPEGVTEPDRACAGRTEYNLMGETQQHDKSSWEAGTLVWDNLFLCGLTTCDQEA